MGNVTRRLALQAICGSEREMSSPGGEAPNAWRPYRRGMLVDGYEIESSLDRERLWAELVALETISQWSALEECTSTDSPLLEPTSSYVCKHTNGLHGVDATVEVTDFEESECLALRTETPIADLDERLVLTDHLGGSLVTYSVDATSDSFGPAATVWLHRHVTFVARKLEQFANRDLA